MIWRNSEDYFEKAFKSIGIVDSDEILDRAVLAIRGFLYLMQLRCYYVIQYTSIH